MLQEVGDQTPNDIMYRKLSYKAGEKNYKIQTNSARNNSFVSFLYTESIWKPKVQSTGAACMGKAQGNLKRKLVALQYRDSENTTDACSTLNHTDLSMISKLNLHC